MAKSKRKGTKELLQSRPPVVSVLGHIDHGKTTLLDRIRKTDIAASEAGGITQHIGAYQIEFKGKRITFIDTPGHTAFAKMRARGAEVTDLAILVVAADEGVKPQTKESLKFIKEAKVPFLVAVNKTDLPRSDLEKTIKGLKKIGVLVEKRGGEIVLVPVSAKEGKGIDDLLEMILLMAEMEDLKANPNGPFKGVVIDSKLDRSRGSLATVLVKEVTLFLADFLWAGGVKGKVKAMYSGDGGRLEKALPGTPVEVLGFVAVPAVGVEVTSLKVEKEEFEDKKEEAFKKQEEDAGKKLKLILKADTQGTLEAVRLSFPDEVELIFQGVGDICESDIFLAQTTGAGLIGFNVRVPGGVRKLAEIEKVGLKTYQVIYKLLEEVEKQVAKILKPLPSEEILGEAEILKEFSIGAKKIAGCRVLKGRLAQGDKLRLRRGKKDLGDCRAASLKKGKLDVSKVKVEEEFGVMIAPQLDFMPGDVLVSFRKLPS